MHSATLQQPVPARAGPERQNAAVPASCRRQAAVLRTGLTRVSPSRWAPSLSWNWPSLFLVASITKSFKKWKRKINKKWFPAARAGLCESEGETVGDQLRGSDKGQVTKKIIIIDVISFCVTSGKDQKQGKDPRSKKPSPSNLAFSTPGRKGRSSQNFLRQPSFMRLNVILLHARYSGVWILQHAKTCGWLQGRSKPNICFLEQGREWARSNTTSSSVLPGIFLLFNFLSCATN